MGIHILRFYNPFPWVSVYLNILTRVSPFDCFYFSVAAVATPGYGGYYPKPAIWGLPSYQILATFEAIFGTFMWVAFIATFARKYIRA